MVAVGTPRSPAQGDARSAKLVTVDLLLAERFLLISLNPRTGKTDAYPALALRLALAGALVMDLLFRGVAELQGDRVVPVRPAAGDPLLDQTLGRIAVSRRPRTLKHWVRAIGDPRRQLLARLVERGVLAERRHRVMGLFPTTRHVLVVPAALEETVAPLRAVLTGQPWNATPAMLALVSLVSVTGLVGRIVPSPYLKDARRRAKAIARGDLGGQAVSDAVRQSQAAVNASVMAAISAGTTSATISSINS